MVIDVHVHLWLTDTEKCKVRLLTAMDRYGIEKLYVSTLRNIIPSVETIEVANNATYKFARENPGRIGGYVYVSPEHPNAMDVLRRGVEDNGAEGVKFWCSRKCDDPLCFPIVEKAIEYNIPVLIHSFHKATQQYTYETVGENVAHLARRYPESKIIMAHLGGNCYNGIPPIMDCKNVSCDISGSIFRSDEVDYTVEMIGAQRILFGTDMPGSYVVDYGQIVGASLTDEERELILRGNALRLFDRSVRA